MSWDEAIRMAATDGSYDLSKLKPEDVEAILVSKVDPTKIEKMVADLKTATESNESNAKKVANVVSILQTALMIGKAFIV